MASKQRTCEKRIRLNQHLPIGIYHLFAKKMHSLIVLQFQSCQWNHFFTTLNLNVFGINFECVVACEVFILSNSEITLKKSIVKVDSIASHQADDFLFENRLGMGPVSSIFLYDFCSSGFHRSRAIYRKLSCHLSVPRGCLGCLILISNTFW